VRRGWQAARTGHSEPPSWPLLIIGKLWLGQARAGRAFRGRGRAVAPARGAALLAQDRTAILNALNHAVSRLHAYESGEPDTGAEPQVLPPDLARRASSPTSSRAGPLAAVGP
jgi:hypothetical protein